MDDKSHFDEVSDRNEEHAIGNQRKSNPTKKVAKNLAEFCLCPSVLRKVELANDEIESLAEEISK